MRERILKTECIELLLVNDADASLPTEDETNESEPQFRVELLYGSLVTFPAAVRKSSMTDVSRPP